MRQIYLSGYEIAMKHAPTGTHVALGIRFDNWGLKGRQIGICNVVLRDVEVTRATACLN